MSLEFGLHMTVIGVAGVFASLAIIAVACMILKRLFKESGQGDVAVTEALETHQKVEEIKDDTASKIGLFRIRIDEEEHSVQVREMGTEKDSGELKLPTDLGEAYNITVDGEKHTVQVEEKPQSAAKITKKRATLIQDETASQVRHTIRAPMRGTVVRIHVKPGDKIQKGKLLLVLETMKMENAIESPVSGTVESVKVAEGEAIDADSVLVLID